MRKISVCQYNLTVLISMEFVFGYFDGFSGYVRGDGTLFSIVDFWGGHNMYERDSKE